jgi:hypothetical protein
MTTKTIDVAREFARAYLVAAELDPTASDHDVTRGIRRSVEAKFPGITIPEMMRASAIAMDEIGAFVDEFERRTKELGTLVEAMGAVERHGQNLAPLKAAYRAASAELEALGKMTPENMFPTKPDKSKS